MATPSSEKIRDSDWLPIDFETDPDFDRNFFDAVPVRRMGTAAVMFLSKAQYEPRAAISRNGRPLAELHAEHSALMRERGELAPRGSLLEFELEDGLIGYNCSQAFEQIVENDDGQLEVRWYIALRTEIEGTEVSEVGFYYQPKSASIEPPTAGVWKLDSKRQLVSEEVSYVEDETPWKPDPRVLFIRPNLGNAGLSVPPDKSYDIPNTPDIRQDPSVASGKINGETLLVMTVVKATGLRPFANQRNAKRMSYQQEFFIGNTIDTMEKIGVGPAHRKATRVVYLGDNRWGVFNRPQGEYLPGVMTYAEFTATSKEEFVQEFEKAILDISTVIPDLCQPDEWVGPNFAWPLKDGKIGVIGHLAAMLNPTTGEREYSAISFVYDPVSNTAQETKVIVTKEAFDGLVGRRIERDDLDNVIYPGGAVVLPNGKIRLYCGISDLNTGYVDIDDPFVGLRLETVA